MIPIEDIRDMDSADVGDFVREIESDDDLERLVWFAQVLRDHAVEELEFRQQ